MPKEYTLGERLRATRHAAGLSQADLAERSGIPKPTLSRYENDHVLPSVATLRRLASALDVTVSDLISAPEPGEKLIAEALRRRGIVVRNTHEAEQVAELVSELRANGSAARRRA